MSKRQKRYSYAAHLDGGQRRAAARLFGCCRWVYNAFLVERERLYREGRHREVEWKDTARTVTTVAKRQPETAWLAEVSAVPLQQAADDARRAYSNWFTSMSGRRKGPRVGRPRFKRRMSRQSARFTANARFTVRTEPGCKWAWVQLQGVGEVKFLLSRPLPAVPSSVTLIRDADGTYRVSFVVAVPAEPEVEPAHPGRVASVDVGVGDDLAVVQDSTLPAPTKPHSHDVGFCPIIYSAGREGRDRGYGQTPQIDTHSTSDNPADHALIANTGARNRSGHSGPLLGHLRRYP